MFSPVESAEASQSSISSAAYKQVIHLLQLVRTSGCRHADVAALFMDELSSLIARKYIDPRVEVRLWILPYMDTDITS